MKYLILIEKMGTRQNYQKQGRYDLQQNVFLSLEAANEKYVNIEHSPFVNVMIGIEIYE